jgi:hypothetical protein
MIQTFALESIKEKFRKYLRKINEQTETIICGSNIQPQDISIVLDVKVPKILSFLKHEELKEYIPDEC